MPWRVDNGKLLQNYEFYCIYFILHLCVDRY